MASSENQDTTSTDEALRMLRELHRTNGESGWKDGFLIPKAQESKYARGGAVYMSVVHITSLAHLAGYSARLRVCRRTPGFYRVNLDPLPGVPRFRKVLDQHEEVRGD